LDSQQAQHLPKLGRRVLRRREKKKDRDRNEQVDRKGQMNIE